MKRATNYSYVKRGLEQLFSPQVCAEIRALSPTTGVVYCLGDDIDFRIERFRHRHYSDNGFDDYLCISLWAPTINHYGDQEPEVVVEQLLDCPPELAYNGDVTISVPVVKSEVR